MERGPAPLTTIDNNNVFNDSDCGEPLDETIDAVINSEVDPDCEEEVTSSSLKRRSLGAVMELHQKRQALPDSGAFEQEEEPTVVRQISHLDRRDDESLSHADTSYAKALIHYQRDVEQERKIHAGFTAGVINPPASITSMFQAEALRADESIPAECHSQSINRQAIDGIKQPSSSDRMISVCIGQSAGVTNVATYQTQGSCQNVEHFPAPPFAGGICQPNCSCPVEGSQQDISMGSTNGYEEQQRPHQGDSLTSNNNDMDMHDDEQYPSIELMDSYTGTNDYGMLSQMANPEAINQLDDTAIMDTMLGASNSIDDSMINMMAREDDMTDQLDALQNLEMRRLSNGSVNLASDCGDVKRQIVVDENLTNTILKDLICAICLEYFYFPVTLSCGHTFCRYCIGHLRLAGKLCPLCRKEVGRPPSVNTIMWNLVKALKIRKRPSLPPTPPDISLEEEKAWWDEHCLKPFMSLPLFLRIMFGDIVQTPPFFDDVCTCVVDYFDRNNKWHKTKWVFTLEDSRILRRLVGYDGDNLDVTSSRLHHWVENYLSVNPQLCCGIDESYPFVLRVYSDINHKIEGISFNASNIHHRLPWDAGRHQKSLLHLPHSSVSLSHLVFAPCGSGQVGILDCGSTIGTMIKLQGQRSLQDGDRIHVGDKHEVDVLSALDDTAPSYQNYRWDSQRKEVVDISVPETSMCDMTFLEPIDRPIKLRIYADGQEEREVWTNPKGIILGRGPQTQSAFTKISITTQNGYISREHCLVYYDGNRAPEQRWVLRDMSTLGTFLKVKPFQTPVPIEPGFMFKVGQCKIEVSSPSEISNRRTVNSPAALILSQLIQSHFTNAPSGGGNTQGEQVNAGLPGNEQSEE